MLRQSWKDWVVAALGLFVLILLVGTSEPFKDCIHERKNQQPYSALHERGPIFRATIMKLRTRLSLNVAGAGNFADTNQGAITALATGLLAIFTFTLWRSTSRLWKASIEQTTIAKRALFDVERPHFFLENLKMHDFYFSQAEHDPPPRSVFPSITYDITTVRLKRE
jgi:hypothetical protein